MNKENIKKIIKHLRGVNYKDLFGALVLNEKVDFEDLEDLTDSDIDYLESIYDEFMSRDDLTLLNSELLEIIEGDEYYED